MGGRTGGVSSNGPETLLRQTCELCFARELSEVRQEEHYTRQSII